MKLKIVFPALVAASLAMPGGLSAQMIPVDDREAQKDRIVSLIGRGADWVATANWWLKEMRGKTDALIEKTELIRRTTRNYEDRALGELGKLGDDVMSQRTREDMRVAGEAIDEFGVSSVCGISKTTDSLCSAGQKIKARYEKAMDNVVNKSRYADTVLFASLRGVVETQAYSLIGPTMTQRAMLAAQNADKGLVATWAGLTFRQPVEAAASQADQAIVLDKAASGLSDLMDDAVTQEVSGNISSGRALQIDARLTFLEAGVEIDRAAAMVKSLDSYVLMTAQQMSKARRDEMAAKRSARVW